MRRNVLTTYPHRCTGCRLCEQWCAWQHHGAVSPAKSRITVSRVHARFLNVPVACAQCAEAPCISACPEGAIHRDAVTGGLVLDEQRCVGCRLCLEACPRGCIAYDAEAGVPLLCDLCGGTPQCVAHCREGAVVYLEPDLAARGRREPLLAQLTREEERGR